MSKIILYDDTEYTLIDLPMKIKKKLFGSTDSRLKITRIGLKSITALEQSIDTAKFIYDCMNIKDRKITIVDANAGYGGNLIGLLANNKLFNVAAIEYDSKNYEILNNNMSVLFKDFSNLYEGDCFDIIPKINELDVIFLDPPWNLTNSETISHTTIGYPDRSTEDAIKFSLDYADTVIIKTSRQDKLELYNVPVLKKFCVSFYNYKLMVFSNKQDLKQIIFYNKGKIPFYYKNLLE